MWLNALIRAANRTAGTVELPTNRLVGMPPLELAGAARVGITPDGEYAFIPDQNRSDRERPNEVAVVAAPAPLESPSPPTA